MIEYWKGVDLFVWIKIYVQEYHKVTDTIFMRKTKFCDTFKKTLTITVVVDQCIIASNEPTHV